MALSCLLVLKSPLRLHFRMGGQTHFTKRRLYATIRVKEREPFMGFDKNLENTISQLPISTRWHSSSSYDPPSNAKEKSKPSETAMEQEAKTVKADSRNYMKMHLGLSKSTPDQTKEGKPWYSLSGLTRFKEKILGILCQNQTSGERTDVAADKTQSKVVTTSKSRLKSGNGERNHSPRTTQATMDPCCKDDISTSEKSESFGGNSTDVVDAIASKPFEIQKDMHNTESVSLKGTLESSRAVSSSTSQDNNSINKEYLVSEVASGITKVHNDPKNSELGKSQSIAQSSEVLVDSLSNEKCFPVNASSYKRKKRSSCEAGANGFEAGHGNQKIDKKTATFVQKINADFHLDNICTPSDGSRMNKRLANQFMSMLDDQMAKEIPSKETSSFATPNGSLGTSNEPSGEDTRSSFDYSNLIDCTKQIICKEGLDMNRSIEKGSTQNKLLVRFLDENVDKQKFQSAFGDCGPIMKIEQLSPIKGSIFKDMYVYFKTRKALQNALMKTDLTIGKSNVLVEATCSEEHVPKRILIPNPIGDPDVPVALVKNPTRTVMIKHLAIDISSHQLKQALGFCGSRISSVFFGSSSSVAYVEFETEDAKDLALAKHTIHIQGEKLSIFRIDVPRTTIVRISNFDDSNGCQKIEKICNSYGQVKNLFFRRSVMVDVHFKISEWPNMLNILNSLNGLKVDGKKWIAQPAPVFPPEMLKLLWTQPEERKHVISVLRRLLQNLKDDSIEGNENL
ncbi:hypothetical protein FNV43_RR01407 [Rhamnella rubrinervis]|uniref:RRM domain-containing protein n=1 Tax=Rhamnella rubrinervis TaxID=2594499 RepID=A0A8K0HRE8_9ROSA|nr:hypothetical protein FNV43_RR01407 [Rhamnella rubrinervis]